MLNGEETALDKLNNDELRVDQLTRDVGILSSNYQQYSVDAERARVDSQLEQLKLTNIAVTQPATLDYMPVFPIIPLNLSLGLVLGVFLGGLTALMAEARSFRQRTRRSPTTVNHIERPEAERRHIEELVARNPR